MSNFVKISNKIEKLEINNPKNPNPRVVWTNIINPGKAELEYLRKDKKYSFHLPDLYASSGKAIAQRPEIRKNKNYFFMIIHFPIFQNGKIVAEEIEFFVGHGFLITLHNNNIPALRNFFDVCKKESTSSLSYELESSAVLLYEILDKLVKYCYELLDTNSQEMDKIEKLIFANAQKKATSEILALRRNVIILRKIIQNHKNILKKLMEMKSSLINSSKLKSFYSDLIEHVKRIWEYSENQREVIEALHDTNQSMLNFRLNNVMKTLTIFSVIVFPLTLLAAIFGMNTIGGMPFIDSPRGFWIVMSIMTAGCIGMILVFLKKRWL